MKRTLILAAIVLCTAPLVAQKKVVESFRPAKPLIIDGNMSDWETDWLMDSKGRFNYNIANDDEFLYYRIKMVDEMTQRKVGLFGLSVLLNPSGKKVGKMGIKFPMGLTPDEVKAIKHDDGPPTEASMIQLNKDLIKDAEALELIGLAKEHIVSSRLGLMNGIQVIIVADDKGDYFYEGKIPFKAFKMKRADIKLLGVTFQTGRLVNTGANAQAAASSGPPMGGFGGNGYGGGYGGATRMSGPTGYVPYSEFQAATTVSLGVELK